MCFVCLPGCSTRIPTSIEDRPTKLIRDRNTMSCVVSGARRIRMLSMAAVTTRACESHRRTCTRAVASASLSSTSRKRPKRTLPFEGSSAAKYRRRSAGSELKFNVRVIERSSGRCVMASKKTTGCNSSQGVWSQYLHLDNDSRELLAVRSTTYCELPRLRIRARARSSSVGGQSEATNSS